MQRNQKPGLVASYDVRPGNRAGLFSKEKISKEKVKKKSLSGDAHSVNKQTIYTVLKSTNESRIQYSPEPTRGRKWGWFSWFGAELFDTCWVADVPLRSLSLIRALNYIVSRWQRHSRTEYHTEVMWQQPVNHWSIPAIPRSMLQVSKAHVTVTALQESKPRSRQDTAEKVFEPHSQKSTVISLKLLKGDMQWFFGC